MLMACKVHISATFDASVAVWMDGINQGGPVC